MREKKKERSVSEPDPTYMAEGDFYGSLGNRQRFLRDPFGETPFRDQSLFRDPLSSRFMDEDFTMAPFTDDLDRDWPGWARPGLFNTRLGTSSPFSRGFQSRPSSGAPALYTNRYGEHSPRNSPVITGEREPWKVCVNVHSFKPEELNVKTRDGFVEVSGE